MNIDTDQALVIVTPRPSGGFQARHGKTLISPNVHVVAEWRRVYPRSQKTYTMRRVKFTYKGVRYVGNYGSDLTTVVRVRRVDGKNR